MQTTIARLTASVSAAAAAAAANVPAMLGCAVVATVSFASHTALAAPLFVDVLDIGQGDAIVIRTQGNTVVIDSGHKDSPTIRKLDSLGVAKIDMLISSHPHSDHIGKMADILRRFDVRLVVTSGQKHTTKTYQKFMLAITEQMVPWQVARRGQRLQLADDAVLTVMWPMDRLLMGTRSDLNSNSVVLLLEHEGHKFLFTGDAEEPTELALMQGGLMDIDVLKVAHHGSGHSSSVGFLAATRPEWALISAGKDNDYGHPKPAALARLKSAGATPLVTAEHGDLRVVSDKGVLSVFAGNQEVTNFGLTWAAEPVTVNLPAALPRPGVVATAPAPVGPMVHRPMPAPIQGNTPSPPTPAPVSVPVPISVPAPPATAPLAGLPQVAQSESVKASLDKSAIRKKRKEAKKRQKAQAKQAKLDRKRLKDAVY